MFLLTHLFCKIAAYSWGFPVFHALKLSNKITRPLWPFPWTDLDQVKCPLATQIYWTFTFLSHDCLGLQHKMLCLSMAKTCLTGQVVRYIFPIHWLWPATCQGTSCWIKSTNLAVVYCCPSTYSAWTERERLVLMNRELFQFFDCVHHETPKICCQ